MNHARERGRNRRTFRLEGLEGRHLLSIFHPDPAVVAIQARQNRVPGPPTAVSTIQGRVAGTQASDGLYSGTPPLFVSYSGHGRANPFGDVLFGTTFFPSSITTAPNTQVIVRGTAVVNSFKGGNQIWAEFDGTGSTLSRSTGALNLKGVVRGGTGRFLNAAGTITATGTIHGQRFSLNFTVQLNPPV
jgi:hypothetical protein